MIFSLNQRYDLIIGLFIKIKQVYGGDIFVRMLTESGGFYTWLVWMAG